MNWYLKVIKEHYLDFKGRARRQEYWMFVLISTIISITLTLIDNFAGLMYASSGLLSSVYSLLVLIPYIAVTVRRLHDAGKSGWYYLLVLLPIIGWIWLIVLLCKDSEHGVNKWGDNPKGIGNDSVIDQIGAE